MNLRVYCIHVYVDTTRTGDRATQTLTHTLINCIQLRMTMATTTKRYGIHKKLGINERPKPLNEQNTIELREWDMPLCESYIPYYNPILRNAIVKKRQHLTMLSRTRQILLPHKEKSGRQIVIFFTSVGCTSYSPKL